MDSRLVSVLVTGCCFTAGAGGFYVATANRPAPAAMADPAPLQVDAQPPAELASPAAPRAAPSARRPALSSPDTSRPQSPRSTPRAVATPPPASDTGTGARNAVTPVTPATIPAGDPYGPTVLSTPPVPEFLELVVPADSVIGLQVENSVTSESARVEDEVTARVTRDVRVGDRVAIPAGARVHGIVTLVERGGRVRDSARLGIRFDSVVLADGTRVALQTDTIYREGASPGSGSAARIGGGAIGGAVIGGILGGTRGAVIGGSIGAGAGTAAALAGRDPAVLPAGTPVTARLLGPSVITVER